MKFLPIIVSVVFCASMMTACGGGDDKGDGNGHMYNAALLGNPGSLDPQYADDPSSNTVIKNLYSGLMQTDSSGNLSCCNAESYEVSGDGLIYTFRLRQDNYWFFDSNENDYIDEDEYFPVTADDYVFAFRRILDPQMHSPYAESFTCIKGGSDVLKGSSSPESIGVTAVGDYELRFTLEYPSAEFLTLLSTAAAYPCNKEFFDSTKGRYGLDDKSVMSNGAFYVRQWFYDPYGVNNILYMKKNSANDCENYEICPSYLSFSIEANRSDISSLFKEGDIDCMTTLSGSYSSKKYAVSGSKAITLGLIFNSNDKIYSNSNMQKALAYSIDREKIQGQLSKDVTAAYGIIPPAAVLMGRSYRELSSDKIFSCYDAKKALDYYNSAKSELNMESFETVKILVSTDSIDSGYLHLLSQQWQELLGCYIGVEEVTAEEFESRLESGDYKIALYPLKGESQGCMSVLEQFDKVEYLKSGESAVISEEAASASELVSAYSEAEKKILEEFSFIPLFYKNVYLVAGKDNEDIFYDPFSEAVDFRLAKNYD